VIAHGRANGHGVIENDFAFGGFSRNLHRFSGKERQSPTSKRTWGLRGHG
jgi:hypothetical protein